MCIVTHVTTSGARKDVRASSAPPCHLHTHTHIHAQLEKQHCPQTPLQFDQSALRRGSVQSPIPLTCKQRRHHEPAAFELSTFPRNPKCVRHMPYLARRESLVRGSVSSRTTTFTSAPVPRRRPLGKELRKKLTRREGDSERPARSCLQCRLGGRCSRRKSH